MEARWEGDTRGEGSADGRQLAGDVDELRRLLTRSNWVAEDPEVHLLPHLQQACASPEADFALASSEIDGDGTFVVTLRLRTPGSSGHTRTALFALLAHVAETVTYVRERPRHEPNSRGEVIFDVATGIPSGDGPFATHGHLIRFRVLATASL